MKDHNLVSSITARQFGLLVWSVLVDNRRFARLAVTRITMTAPTTTSE